MQLHRIPFSTTHARWQGLLGLIAVTVLATAPMAKPVSADDNKTQAESNDRGDFNSDESESKDDRKAGKKSKGGRPNEVRLLWTNDTHGFFLPVFHAEPDNIDQYAGIAATEGPLGGYAQIVTLVKKYKPQRVNALFTDSGDTFDGSPVAQMTRGEAIVPILNAMGYDAWVPGNRDFAYGKEDFLRVMDMIKIPTVATTLRDADTGELVFPPYRIIQLPTKKVLLVGLVHPLVTEGFALGEQLAPNGSPQGFEVADEVSELIAKLRAKEHPDLVVAMSHFGKLQDLKFATLQSGIDVILGGHSHDVFEDPAVLQGKDGRNVIVVQAGSHGVYLGMLDVKVEYNREITVANYDVKRIISKDVKPDRKILKIARRTYAPFKKYLDRQIGYTTTTIWRRGDTQSNMANLLLDAYAEIFGADLSHFRGIRYGETLPPGPLTVGDVWNMVSPNWGDNKVYTGAVKGQVVFNILNHLTTQQFGDDPYQWPGGDVMRWNKNVHYTYKVDAPDNHHIVDLKIGNDYLVQNGVQVPENLDKMYTFAATTPPPPVPQSGTPVPNTTAVDEIVHYIENRQTVSPVLDDRTVQLD